MSTGHKPVRSAGVARRERTPTNGTITYPRDL